MHFGPVPEADGYDDPRLVDEAVPRVAAVIDDVAVGGEHAAPARAGALARVAFRFGNSVGIRNHGTFAARWLTCTVPCRRFAPGLAARHARLGADVDRYSFVVSDSHRLLLAGLPAHYQVPSVGFRTVPRPPTPDSPCGSPGW